MINTQTGRIYEGDEIGKARKRGEPVVEVSERVAELMKLANEIEIGRHYSPIPPRRIDPKGHQS